MISSPPNREVEAVDPKSLVPHPRNYRKHTKTQLRELRASMRLHGVQPTVVARPTDRVIIAGHGVVQAAIAEKLPTVLVTWWEASDEDLRAYLVADNEIPRLAVDDDKELAALLEDLSEATPGLAGTGWTEDDLESLLREVSDMNGGWDSDGDGYAVPATPKSQPALYELGPHRLLLVDDEDDEGHAAKLLGEHKANVLISEIWDPHNEAWRTETALERLRCAIPHTEHGGAWWLLARPGPAALPLLEFLHANGIWRQTLVWRHLTSENGHRAIYYGWVPGAAHAWFSDRKQASVVDVEPDNLQRPWGMSARLAEYLLRHNTSTRSIVFDPDAGMGGSLMGVAMAQRGRWRGIVRSAACADVIRRRWTEWAQRHDIEAGSGALSE